MARTVASTGDERERTIRRGSSEAPESFVEALVIAIKAAGGSKVIGPMLWPELPVDAAQRRLLDCMNEDRPQHLSPQQVELVMRKARQVGCHAPMDYLAQSLSYAEPQPVAPTDEAAELQRQFIAATAQLARMAERIEQLNRPGPRAVA